VTPDPDLESFVRDSFKSVWSVEVLLLLKAAPQRGWTARDIDAELRASPTAVSAALGDLTRAGLVAAASAEAWRYAPAEPRLADLAERLAEAFRQSPVSLINLIAKPAQSAQWLADAFKFRGPK